MSAATSGYMALVCGEQHPEYPNVTCINQTGTSMTCWSHRGILSSSWGGWTEIHWNSTQAGCIPPYKLTVSSGTFPTPKMDLTLDEIHQIITSDDFTGEFFLKGENITKQVKKMSKMARKQAKRKWRKYAKD